MFDRFQKTFFETPVTIGIIAFHSIIYGFLMTIDEGFSSFLLNPQGTDILKQTGAQVSHLVWEGEYYRLITCAFLHGTLFHLCMNNLALLVLGRILERLFGSIGFAIVYFVSLIGGSLASLYWTFPLAVSVGSSGAIMGLAGALTVFVLLDHQEKFLITTRFGKISFLFLVFINLMIGELVDMINGPAHLGGFVAGSLLTIFFWSRIPGVLFPKWIGKAAFFFGIILMGFFSFHAFSPKGSPIWHFYQGIKAFQDGNASAAETHLRRAHKMKPKQMTYLYLGELYAQTEQWKKSIHLYEKATEFAPKDVGNWLQRVTAHTKLGERKKAHFVFEKAESLFPKVFQQDSYYTLFLSALGKEKEAITSYLHLLEDEPLNPNHHNNLAWLFITSSNRKLRNPQKALFHAKEAVSSTKSQVAAYLDTLASVYYELGEFERAIETAEKALLAPGVEFQAIHIHQQLKKFKKKAPNYLPLRKKKTNEKDILARNKAKTKHLPKRPSISFPKIPSTLPSTASTRKAHP